MRRFIVVLLMGVIAFITAGVTTKGSFAQSGAKAQYEVMNPWAEADPKPVRGISPRLQTLSGKKIGLFANYKRASRPILAEVEKGLKAKYPDVQTSLFHSTRWNVTEAEYDKAKWESWIKGVDAVVASVGD
jgi:hypothetical protein